MRSPWIVGAAGLWLTASLDPAPSQEKAPPKKGPVPLVVEALKKSPQEFVKQFDKNRDGFLDKDELPPFLAKTIERFDRNGDGRLNQEETGAMIDAMRRLLAAQQSGGGKGFFPGGGNPQDFDSLDKDADGRLTREEVKGSRWAADFARIDANGDGRIDRREWEAFQRKTEEKK